MNGKQLASDIKFYLDYSKWRDDDNRYETWEESVDRVMDMHKTNPKFKEAFKDPWFVERFELATESYKNKSMLGSQRALQFGGAPMMKHQMRMFNCLGGYIDRVEAFQECMYLLLCGCGVGFSVQKHHISQLPNIKKRTKGTKTFVIPDSIEGWSDALGILISSYVEKDASFSEYKGYNIKFDYSLIRPKGAKITGGFKAPGPDGLKASLEKIEALIEKTLNEGNTRFKSIVIYDIVMHASDAVLSGGVRRSATICLFSPDDEDMMTAKTGNWFSENPQRARSNNSVVLLRNETTFEQFQNIIEKVKQYGEPGFYFTDNLDAATNPCVEIGFYPKTKKGKSGWQGCNLVEGNGSKCNTKEQMFRVCEDLAFVGTLQAAYTDFVYVSPTTKEIFDGEALLGVSFTGWMNNPEVMLSPENMREGAKIVLTTNERAAKLIGINPAARATCTKPAGNSSVLLGTASGCHGDEYYQFFRLMQINKEHDVSKFLLEKAPELIEESVWSRGKTDYVAYLPVEVNRNSILKQDLKGVKQLEVVKSIQQNWVLPGARPEFFTAPGISHNVSNTVNVDSWEDVTKYIYDNKEYLTGVSFYGDIDYKQSPFTKVLTGKEIFEKYGDASLFASGLIIDGLHAFDNDLWDACEFTSNKTLKLDGSRLQVLVKKDWIRRAKQFAKRYFKNNIGEMVQCLKYLHLYHKWVEIKREVKSIDLKEANIKPEFTDIDTMGAMSCAGGACEVDFSTKIPQSA